MVGDEYPDFDPPVEGPKELERVPPPKPKRKGFGNMARVDRGRFGDARFWAVIDDVAAENDENRQDWKSFEQWGRIFEAATLAMSTAGTGLPEFVVYGLARQKRVIEQANMMRMSAKAMSENDAAVLARQTQSSAPERTGV